VTEVIPPLDDPLWASKAPPVPQNQQELVPNYYRESPFSRAWMKLVDIESGPIDFFGNYSFAEVPQLPNYTPATLARLKGKVILKTEELRSMDTTIWRVRPADKGHDLSEVILLSVQALSSPISSDVVRCQSNFVLHLTDPHFAVGPNRGRHVWRLESENEHRSTLAEAVKNGIGNNKIGLVVVTGDLTFTGTRDEFREASTSIVRLLGLLDLSPDHLVVIPGNHDIQWTTNAVYQDDAVVNVAPPEARKNYEQFYRSLFRHEPHKHLAMGRRFLLPGGIALEVCGLNSSSLETGKHFLAGTGRIQEASFGDVADEFGWRDSATLALRIVAVHHHLALVEDVEPIEGYTRGYGLAIDAVRIQRMATKRGAQLVMHGHKHRAFLWRSTVYELPEFAKTEYRLGELSIIGGGTAGSTDTEGKSNYFNLLSLSSEGAELAIYQSRDRGLFECMQNWHADLTIGLSPKRLVLGEWRLGGE
jgi:hypothetical protein